ncbi:MAG: nuclear transport factor 2 family protein [Betaproteobacteria bacterium]
MSNQNITPVDAQLAAYNAHDVEAFMVCYTPDCVIEDGTGARLLTGHAEMRPRYQTLFASSPNLHCEIASRICIGDYVIDEERITGRVPDMRHAVVIYHVDKASGLISHVRFLRESD